MRSSIKKLLFILVSVVVITLFSCNPDDDKDVDQRDKFIGAWTCTETSHKNPAPIDFSVHITKNELTTNEILLSNFYLLGNEEKITIRVDYSNLSIAQQTVCDMTVHGSGAYNQGKVNLVYYVNDGADIDTVNAVLSK